VPTDLNDYRTVYRSYLSDPDLQDARARWPFVCMWDNHEFSWNGWQSLQNFGGGNIPAQSRKVAANQAWFEYQPSRTTHSGRLPMDFKAPKVSDAAFERFDANGLGDEPNNRAAINSLTGYRTLRWGRNVELMITDQHSYRSEEPTGRPEAQKFSSPDFPEMMPQEIMEALDAGRVANGGVPSQTLRFGENEVANFRKDAPPQTILGARQKAWFLDCLKRSRATWKIWAVSQGVMDWRADPQNLPVDLTRPWPGTGYAGFGGGDHSAAYTERSEIYDFVARERISGFASIAGDRHSFWAGLAAKSLPPNRFEPVGVSFVTGSISAPTLVEVYEHRFSKSHPLRTLYLADRPNALKPEPTINLLLRHGVKSCLEYAASGDLSAAKAVSNLDNAPHLSFVDMAGHGYAVVQASATSMTCEFVCISRPVERSTRSDGGLLRYRVTHTAKLWSPGESPTLEARLLEGDAGLSL
jgi:alkaline phosphatase D